MHDEELGLIRVVPCNSEVVKKTHEYVVNVKYEEQRSAFKSRAPKVEKEVTVIFDAGPPCVLRCEPDVTSKELSATNTDVTRTVHPEPQPKPDPETNLNLYPNPNPGVLHHQGRRGLLRLCGR